MSESGHYACHSKAVLIVGSSNQMYYFFLSVLILVNVPLRCPEIGVPCKDLYVCPVHLWRTTVANTRDSASSMESADRSPVTNSSNSHRCALLAHRGVFKEIHPISHPLRLLHVLHFVLLENVCQEARLQVYFS